MGSMDSTTAPSSTSGGTLRRVSDIAGWKLLGAGILLQVVLLWVVVALVSIDALLGGTLDSNGYPVDATVMALNRVLVAGVWALAVGGMYYWSRERGLFRQMFTWCTQGRVLVASLAAVALHVVDNIVMATITNESLGPQALGEHAFFVGLYGSVDGSVVFLLQGLYYLFEASIVVFMIGLFQRAGDQWFGRTYLPWGGIGLALTWGALHYLMHPTLEVVVLPLAMGVVYVLGKKHVVPVFLAVVLVFFV